MITVGATEFVLCCGTGVCVTDGLCGPDRSGETYLNM